MFFVAAWDVTDLTRPTMKYHDILMCGPVVAIAETFLLPSNETRFHKITFHIYIAEVSKLLITLQHIRNANEMTRRIFPLGLLTPLRHVLFVTVIRIHRSIV
jgi:hypothetical protein